VSLRTRPGHKTRAPSPRAELPEPEPVLPEDRYLYHFCMYRYPAVLEVFIKTQTITWHPAQPSNIAARPTQVCLNPRTQGIAHQGTSHQGITQPSPTLSRQPPSASRLHMPRLDHQRRHATRRHARRLARHPEFPIATDPSPTAPPLSSPHVAHEPRPSAAPVYSPDSLSLAPDSPTPNPNLGSTPPALASYLGSMPPPPRHSPSPSIPCLEGRRQCMRHGTMDPRCLDLGAGLLPALASSPQIPTSKDAVDDSAHGSPVPRLWSRSWIPTPR
jgi:hypothetical protein